MWLCSCEINKPVEGRQTALTLDIGVVSINKPPLPPSKERGTKGVRLINNLAFS